MSTQDARSVRSRQALLDAGIELLLRNPAATLSEIAAHANVGRATLYRQFESKEQLIQELAIESLEMTSAVIAPVKNRKLSAKATLEEIFKAVMPLADKYHFLLSIWNIAEKDDEVIAIYNQQLTELASLIERGKKEGTINKNLDTSWIVCVIDSLIYSGWWMMGNTGMSAANASAHSIETLFAGISK
ncbi:TetR/AcrR family transcriptional regulator [Aliikangiella coralliicola]|uniref:TetR/AcrR family transcriptional regulator n=1 Tax=Aliikangiella coralliicola TaxID=2592383 RepID=A0A545UCG4_9GAMM|nr:TetR/AcrR family transcriptional regulator [Aliikangiella coralliicola]TQV87158.1 TetR/AcrR family transcriptional regulator [Aliikangiella coralliicola]